MVSSLISQYAQVVLWFCRTGLLPESADEDVLQISRPFYSFSVIKNYYIGQREELQRLAKDKWNPDCLMIDGLVAQCGERLSELWRRDEGGTGQYPPPSLHALLDLYLLENVEELTKHAIWCIRGIFPHRFLDSHRISKLVQGLWLLDHHDHENSLDLLLHPSVSPCVWAWQHSRVLQALMIQNKHSTALHYFHMMKPSITSTPLTKLCVSVLLHNRCLVEAWALLRQQVNKVSMEELLRFFYEMCQELGLMKELLKLPLQPSEQECLERFLQETGGFQNRELLMVHHLQQANYIPALQINHMLKMNLAGDRDPKMKERWNTRNSIMNQYGKVLPRAQRKLAIDRAKPYQNPSTVLREVPRPQPLSTVAKRSANKNVLSRAAFIKNVLTKIEEVWIGKDTTPEHSPLKSPKAPDALMSSPNPPTLPVPEAFVGTPINMLTKRMSRLFDLAVQPSPHAQTTPPKSLSSWSAPKHISRAPELSLLHTPQVVKRARALAASGPVFSSFTPQSILRSSLRPSPIATPTASPTRSATPPLRTKESRITFLEEIESPDMPKSFSLHWSKQLTAFKVTDLEPPSLPPGGRVEKWSEHSAEEEEDIKEPSGILMSSLKHKDALESEKMNQVLPTLERRPSLGHETSTQSAQSDSTLEFHDAPSSDDIIKTTWQLHDRLDEDDEIIVKRQESETATRTLTVEEPNANQETEHKKEVPEIEMQPEAEEEHPNKDSEVQNKESLGKRETHNFPVVPDTSLEESNQDDLANHEMTGSVPCQPIRNTEKMIREKDTKGTESTQPPIINDAVPEEEPIRESPRKSVEHSVVSKEPISELPAVSEELKDKPEALETSDLDEYVERELFGDLSPPHSHSDSKEVSESNSKPCRDGTDLGVEDEAHKSVTSSEAALSESQSVVSVNDTEELSSSEEEEYEGEEEDEKEDSGSEVEIIEEVQGNGTQQQLYLPDLQPEDQFLREQAAAVLSLVTDPQLEQVIDRCVEEEGQVVVVGLRPASLGDVCYTELKPSTTLLVPIELAAEHQELLHSAEMPEIALPVDSNNFSLVLEGDDEEPAALEMDPESLLTVQMSTKHAGDLEEEPSSNSDNIIIEHAVLEPEERFQIQELPSEMIVPEAVEPDKPVNEVQMETEVCESKSNTTDQPEKTEVVQEEQTGEKRLLRSNSDPADEAQTVEEPEEKPVKPLDQPIGNPLQEAVIGETFDVTDVCFSSQIHDSGLSAVTEDEKMPDEEVVLESSEIVPAADGRNAKLKQATEATADLKEVQRSPGRRGRKTVTFPITIMESQNDASDGERAESKVPSTPRRVTRSSRQMLESDIFLTPRRSTRRTNAEVVVEEVTSTKVTPQRKTPLKSTPRRGSRKTDNMGENDVEAQKMEDNSTVEHQSARKTRKVATVGVPEPIPEEKSLVNQANTNASPSRVTRQSSRRLSLTLESFHAISDSQNMSLVTPPRSRRKNKSTTEEKTYNETYTVDSVQLQNVSRRLTRSHHWNDREELEKPETLESTNLLESTLIERLHNEQAQESEVMTEIVRAKRRTKPVVPTMGHEEQSAEDMESTVSTQQQEQKKKKSAPSVRRTRASKAPEAETTSVSDNTSKAQGARGKKKDVSVNDTGSAPSSTRTRRATTVTDDCLQENVLADVVVEEHKAEVKTRKKRTIRATAEPEPVMVDLLSPLGSPAEAAQQKKPEDRETAAPRMNLRRRRMMEAVFPKPRERDAGSRCIITMSSNSVSIEEPRSHHLRTFTFHYSFWSHSGFIKNSDGLLVPEDEGGCYADQGCVFAGVGQGILDNALQGYNATLLAYGQTGSGKSYSMMGFGANKGLVFFSMLEIYNEQVIDLLSRSSRSASGLRVREDQQRGFYVEGLRRVACDSAVQVEQLMDQGTRTRTTAATHLNANSSRSHMLIIIQLKQIFSKECITKQSNFNLVDLAGSERQRSSGSEVDRLKEGTAINLSLTTLGNVISALAEVALGKKAVYIPYRDSVLTKLLQSALGGNSRTVMIATLSPADICYEESLSTLRYAERAKRIQNKAVVNEGPTERLVKELKAENAKLLLKLSKLDQNGRQSDQERRQERRMMQMFPYMLNINEDAQLSGVIKLFIQEGEWHVGSADSIPRTISIRGLGIQERHAIFSNQQRRVMVTPLTGAKVTVNGASITQTTELQHVDRVILGSNSTFLFIGFPSERLGDDWSRYDYDYFQSELAAAEGVHLHTLCNTPGQRSLQPSPSLLAAFYDYIKLIPMVTEANQMSQELNKGVEFKVEIKNLAMSDSKGHDLEKEIVIRVTNLKSKQVWLWSKVKFINRKFLIEEVYQRGASLPQEKDPFWDPVEPIHLGSAHLWLHSLAFRIAVDEQVEVVGPEGTEEAMLHARLVPCSPKGLSLGEEDILIDPTELLGKRLDFLLILDQCCGLQWVKELPTRGIQIGFQLFDCTEPLYTQAAWGCVNTQLDYSIQFTALNTSHTLLTYLQSNAVILQLWGLQEGCSSMTSHLQSVKKTPENNILIDSPEDLVGHPGLPHCVNISDQSVCLRRLHEDLEQLRNTNAALQKENDTLKEQLNIRTQNWYNTPSLSLPHTHAVNFLLKCLYVLIAGMECARARRGSLKSSCDAEFARVLKKEAWPEHRMECKCLQRVYPRLPTDSVRLTGRIIFTLLNDPAADSKELYSITEHQSHLEEMGEEKREGLVQLCSMLKVYLNSDVSLLPSALDPMNLLARWAELQQACQTVIVESSAEVPDSNVYMLRVLDTLMDACISLSQYDTALLYGSRTLEPYL
ncbi:Kinesin-like protein KIF28P [Bagarius yarrelli]|uniref:Kinesin-like protein KIF28P n=1 Tax=Bagarius yarrelli TaxID=175774 RepID=A0A556VU34_BAGYA|nr:Kinesin-like protein KIF28P [Bagarius yarrelli]